MHLHTTRGGGMGGFLKTCHKACAVTHSNQGTVRLNLKTALGTSGAQRATQGDQDRLGNSNLKEGKTE